MTSILVKKEERLLPLAGNLRQIVRAFQPDIVHDNGIWLPHNHSLARLAAHYNLPRVVSIRGMLEPWALAHNRVKKKLAWLAYQKRDLNRAAALHATAGSEAEVITNLGLLPRVVVLPNGVDIPAATASHSRAPNQPRTALFLSRIHPKKGLDRLINAWNMVRPQGWRLRIHGPGASGYCDEVARRIARAGLERQVSLGGASVRRRQDSGLHFGRCVSAALAFRELWDCRGGGAGARCAGADDNRHALAGVGVRTLRLVGPAHK